MSICCCLAMSRGITRGPLMPEKSGGKKSLQRNISAESATGGDGGIGVMFPASLGRERNAST